MKSNNIKKLIERLREQDKEVYPDSHKAADSLEHLMDAMWEQYEGLKEASKMINEGK